MIETKNKMKEKFLLDIEVCEESISNYEKCIEQSQLGINQWESMIDKKRKEISIIKQLIENIDNLKEDES